MLEKEKSTFQKTLKFVKTPRFFILLKNKNVLRSIQKYVKKWQTAGLEPTTCGPCNRDATPHLFYAIHQHFCRRFLRVIGKIREREKIWLLRWIFSFRNFFRRKILIPKVEQNKLMKTALHWLEAFNFSMPCWHVSSAVGFIVKKHLLGRIQNSIKTVILQRFAIN